MSSRAGELMARLFSAGLFSSEVEGGVGWKEVELPTSDFNEIGPWLNDNAGGKWALVDLIFKVGGSRESLTIAFEHDVDAVFFKLRFA